MHFLNFIKINKVLSLIDRSETTSKRSIRNDKNNFNCSLDIHGLCTLHSQRYSSMESFVNNMAIVGSDVKGWIVSHESFIRNIYKKTKYQNDVRSYYLRLSLFDIKIPFCKNKISKKDSEKIEGDVGIVREAYEVLHKLFTSLNLHLGDSLPENNYLAKSSANVFYDQSTHHSDSKFFGGNSSEGPLVSEIGNELYLIPEKSLFYCYDIRDISTHLKNTKFDLILMDPPWWNKFIRRKRKKNGKFGYEMVYDKELSNIPINSLLDENGIIAVWCTNAPSHIKAILFELFPAWGIQFISQWFWLKITKLGKPICDFSQPLKKQPFERILFGIKKNVIRLFSNPEINKVIMSVPSAIHSHKPPLCELLRPYIPQEPKRLELFARYLLPGWTSYGNEVIKLQHMSLFTEELKN